jgi:hypothetical protein
MKKTIIATLQSELKANLEDYNDYLQLRLILLKFEGKTINQKCVLPDGYAWNKDTNGWHITTPHTKHFVSYDSNLGRAQSLVFKIEYFDANDAPNNAGAKQRSEQLQTILNNPTPFINAYTALSKAYKALQTIVKDIDANYPPHKNPAFFTLLKSVGIGYTVFNGINRNEVD